MPRPWRVRPHLRYLITESGVNPREVKLHQRVHAAPETRPFLNADVVLCLQTIVFRTDWEDVYDVLLAEREAFTDAVRRQLDGEQAAVENLWPDLANLPDSLFEYLDSPADHQCSPSIPSTSTSTASKRPAQPRRASPRRTGRSASCEGFFERSRAHRPPNRDRSFEPSSPRRRENFGARCRMHPGAPSG